jgi:hypothetical protein
MYNASIPLFVQLLGALAEQLKKADTYAAERKFDPAILLGSRLHPTMWPLSRQVQAACTTATGAGARLAGVPLPTFEDTEKSIADLDQRIKRAITFLQGLKPEQIDGSEARDVTMRMGGKEVVYKGQNYLMWFAIPNFTFHVTTAYDIMRHNGVELSKRDFLGPNPST